MSSGVLVIDSDGIGVEGRRLLAVLSAKALHESPSSEEQERFRILRTSGGLMSTPDFGLPQLHRHGSTYPFGNLVLQIEEVAYLLVEPVGPDVNAITGGNKLDVDAQAAGAEQQP